MDSDFSNEPKWMKVAALTVNCIFFVAFISLEYVALKRINFKVERSGIILLGAYSIEICQRLIFDSIRLAMQDRTDNEKSIDQFLRIFLLI